MTTSSTERMIRSSLHFIRGMQKVLPHSLANRFNKIGVSRVQMDADMILEPVLADGVPCDWIIPPKNDSDKVMLYLHGGGFVYGQTPLHLQMGAYLAKKLGFRLLMVDYRTAPQDPFPAALNDCVTRLSVAAQTRDIGAGYRDRGRFGGGQPDTGHYAQTA